MRTTNTNATLEIVDLAELATVTGGCKKKAPQAAPCNCTGSSVDVEVSVGAPPPAQPGASQAPQLI